MDAALRAEIANELASMGASSPILTTRLIPGKLYEIFVLACLVRALRGLGFTPIPKNSTDIRTGNLIFRLAPGTIGAPRSSPGFIHVQSGNIEYEIHNGLRVRGRSKVLHELDVCLINRKDAVKCRNTRKDPIVGMIKFIAECKCYGDRVDLQLGREYLGLSTEFSSVRVKTIVSNVSSDEVHDLITSPTYKGTENFEISPFLPRNIDRFVSWLENELKQVLK